MRDGHFSWHSGDYERSVEIHGHWKSDTRVEGNIYFNAIPKVVHFHANLHVHGIG